MKTWSRGVVVAVMVDTPGLGWGGEGVIAGEGADEITTRRLRCHRSRAGGDGVIIAFG